MLLGNGDGTFQPARSYAAGDSPVSLVAGDFTGDGKLDLAVANGGDTVSVLLGNGDGTFQPASHRTRREIHRSSLVAGDFTGNGKLDLAVAADYAAPASATVWRAAGQRRRHVPARRTHTRRDRAQVVGGG